MFISVHSVQDLSLLCLAPAAHQCDKAAFGHQVRAMQISTAFEDTIDLPERSDREMVCALNHIDSLSIF